MEEQNLAPKQPEPPQKSPRPNPNFQANRDLKVAQNLVLVASLAGPISIFIGGVLLSTAGLVCAIIGLRKVLTLIAKEPELKPIAAMTKRSGMLALVFCSIALVLNLISFFIMLPIVMQMMETGEYGDLMANIGSSAGTSGGTSTWG